MIDNYYIARPLPYDVVLADYPYYMANPYPEDITELCCDSDSSITTDSESTNANGLSTNSLDEFSDDNHPNARAPVIPQSEAL